MTTSSLPLLQLEKFRHPRRSWRMRVTVGALAVCLGLPLSISQAKADPFTTIFAQFNSLFNSVNSYFTSFPNILSQGLSQMFQGVLSPINQTISSSLQPVQNAINSAQGDLLKFRLDLVQNMSASKASTSPFFTNNPALDGAIFATGLDVDWSRAYANFDLGTDGQKKFTDTLNVISSASQNSQTAGSVAQTMDVTQDIQKQVSLQLAQQSFLQAVTASTALKTNQNLQVGNYNLADINETVSGSEQARQSEIGNAAARFEQLAHQSILF